MNRRLCVECAIWMGLCAAAMPASGHAADPASAWPESPLVEAWLAREAAAVRARLNAPSERPAQPAPGARRSTPAVELLAVYGVGSRLAFDLRIGNRRHVLRPDGAAAASGEGRDRIVGKNFDGRCLTLTYQRIARRLCMPGGEVLLEARDAR